MQGAIPIYSSVTRLLLTRATKKSKNQAERQREYRIRKKKLKEAQNIDGEKPAKKTRADYQREYRLRKKLHAKLSSGSSEMIPRQEAGPSWNLAPVTLAQLTPSSPAAGPAVSTVRRLKRVQQYPTGDHTFDEICQLSCQPRLTPHLPNDEMQQISNQHVQNLDFYELMQPQDFYDAATMEHGVGKHVKEQLDTKMTIKTEVEEASTSIAHFDSEINVNCIKEEPGLVDFVKSEPVLLVKSEILEDSRKAATLEHRVGKHVKEQLHTEMTIKTEVEDAATSNAHFDNEINVNCIKEEPGLEHFVKSERALLVKSEILEYSRQDQQPGDRETPAEHQAQSQLYVCDECPKVFKYKASFNVHQIYEHSAKTHKCAKQKTTNADEQQGVAATSVCGIAGKTCVATDSVKQGQLLHIKEELKDTGMDIGPTVLQPMVSHYRTNQSGLNGIRQENKILNFNLEKVLHGIDDGQVECSQVRNKTIESSWKDNKTTSCKIYDQTKTEQGFQEAHLKFCHKQQKNLQQNVLWQHLATSSGGYKYDAGEGTYHKPNLPFLHKKLHQLNKNKTSVSQICALTMHKRVHTGEKPYQCDTCHARFTRRFALTTHMKVHTGEKPYQCDICYARFAHSGSLTTHMRTHSGEKPYQCDMCDVRFAQRNHLMVHIRRHTGEKPYQCDTCNARFAHSNTLTSHKRVHISENAYQYEMSDVRFAK